MGESKGSSILVTLGFTSLVIWAYLNSSAWEREFPFLPLLLAFLVLLGVLHSLKTLGWQLYNFFLRREALKDNERNGSASWATREDLKKAGLYQTDGLFLGCEETGHPLFFDGETHGLTQAPAGLGKSISFSVPALCHVPLPIVVTDFKGTLAVMTKSIREKQYGQEVFCVNPSKLFPKQLGAPARYNPLQILIDDWSKPETHADLLADAQSLTLQLYPEPPQQVENLFWRSGSRKILVFAFIYLVTRGKKNQKTLSETLRLLRNIPDLMSACESVKSSTDLDGELADMAKELHYKLSAKDTRQVDSFLEGAIQSLNAFSSSGWLAESTSACDFRFADLKKEAATVFLIADPTKMKVFAPWLGVMGWAALTELTRERNINPVLFLLEEATNFRIEGISQALTGLREFGIRVWFVIQELEEYAKVYGRESLETLLSQTQVKQIFGVQSQKTADLISSMLGEETIKSPNFTLGHVVSDPVSWSVNDTSRRLLTPDEVRRFADMILFVNNLPPIHAIKTGYHEVSPWNKWVAVNPFFGKKLKGKIRVKLKY